MEEDICFLEHGLPSKNQIVEIVDSYSKISLEDIFFESIWFSKVDSIKNDLEDGDEDVPSCIEKVERQVLYA